MAERPGRSRVFERLGIDYCCGGKRPLEEACREKGLDPAVVAAELDRADASASATEQVVDVARMRMSELCDHIELTHHAMLRIELPRLTALAEKVSGAHGERRPEMREVRDVFLRFRGELEMHMAKEEMVLFPMIRTMEESTSLPAFHCGSVTNPIRMMEHEHDDAGVALARMRALTHDYSPPADACNSFRALLDGLRELELDMHAHVHKENNVLFPRAARREEELRRGAGCGC